MFCHDCGSQLERTDRFAIEKKKSAASCRNCGHYNAIEAEKCESCGLELTTTASVVIRDPHGRLRLVREAPLPVLVRILCGLILVGLGGSLALALYQQWIAAQGSFDILFSRPQALATLALAIAFGVTTASRETNLDYKARVNFFLVFLSVTAGFLYLGPQELVLPGVTLDRAEMVCFSLALVQCLAFLIRAEFLRGLFTSVFFLLGLWGLYPALLYLFEAKGFRQYLGGIYSYESLPLFLTPGFFLSHLFLPAVFVFSLSRIGHQMVLSRGFVESTPTDRAVLRKYRERMLRGVFLDLFSALLPLALLFGALMKAKHWNVASALGKLLRQLF